MSKVNRDKPCPFCGSLTVQTTIDDGCHWGSCPKCSATGPTEFLRSDEDSPGWNSRPDFDRVTAERDAALGREAALQKGFAQKVVLSVRDICELEPADSDDPECICINASDLGAILSRHFEGIE